MSTNENIVGRIRIVMALGMALAFVGGCSAITDFSPDSRGDGGANNSNNNQNNGNGNGNQANCNGYSQCGDGLVNCSEQCEDGNDVDWDGCFDCRIAEFQITQETESNQARPMVAASPNGTFVVSWM